MKYGLPIPKNREEIEDCIVKYNNIIELLPNSDDKKHGLIRGNSLPIYARFICFISKDNEGWNASYPCYHDSVYAELKNAILFMEQLIEKDVDFIESDDVRVYEFELSNTQEQSIQMPELKDKLKEKRW